MSKKLLKARKTSHKASNSKENSEISQEETLKSRRNLVILAAFVLITLSVAGLANWRNLPFSSPANSGPKSASAMVVPSPPTLPSNQPSKEFIYAGNALVATTEPFREAPDDFAVWRPTNGTWYVLNSQQQYTIQPYGLNGDIPAPGDFDGDSKTDFCVYRPSEGKWYIVNSSNGAAQHVTFGQSSDTPVVADYDGDGISDIALFRPGNLTWYIRKSSDTSTITATFGTTNDVPVPADY